MIKYLFSINNNSARAWNPTQLHINKTGLFCSQSLLFLDDSFDRESCSQFHQCFTYKFFVRTSFSLVTFGLAPKMRTKNAHKKRWWNWHLKFVAIDGNCVPVKCNWWNTDQITKAVCWMASNLQQSNNFLFSLLSMK